MHPLPLFTPLHPYIMPQPQSSMNPIHITTPPFQLAYTAAGMAVTITAMADIIVAMAVIMVAVTVVAATAEVMVADTVNCSEFKLQLVIS